MIGKKIFDTLELLGKYSEKTEGITRLFLTKEHEEANNFIENLMKENGLKTRRDNIGNVIGEYFCEDEAKKTLLMGSHQDTVRNGGKYDGALGIILPIISFGELLKENKKPNYNLKIVSFADEEGVRFATTYLGSKVVAGTFKEELLDKIDEKGISLREAIINFGGKPEKIKEDKIENIDTYLEIHIEQGPVLEKENLAVGIVDAIQGSHRYNFKLKGLSGHAGTVPMNFRQDAGAGAAEIIYKLTKYIKSKENIVATIGKIEFYPGAINVIPGGSEFSLDIRSKDEKEILSSMEEIKKITEEVCKENNLLFEITKTNDAKPTVCSLEVVERLKKAFENSKEKEFLLTSGAGHDTQTFEDICDVGMIFLRCKEGISHNPLEGVTSEDLDRGSKVLTEFFKLY